MPTSRTTRPTFPASCARSTTVPISRSDRATSPEAAFRTGTVCGCCVSKAANHYAGWALGLEVRDATSGYRAVRADTLRQIAYADARSTGYGFHVEMTHRVQAAGCTIVEVPICFTDRVRGESKMSMAIVAEAVTSVTLWGARARLPGAGSRAG